MVKTNKSKSAERVGKGKVTPMQVAFLVDRYLCDNRFLETRSIFRSEASSLISKSPLREVPYSLIPLDDILNEYISLKEQKVIVDQEKARLDLEKTRVQNLLHGMQDVMNVYNSTAAPPPAITAAPAAAIQVVSSTSQPSNVNIGVSTSGGTVHHSRPSLMSASLPGNKRVGNFTAPSCTTTHSVTRKRKSPEVSLRGDIAPLSSVSNKGMKKIPRAAMTTNYLTFQPPVNNSVANGSSDLPSTVAKRLCYGSSDMSPPTNSACPKTPQKQVSPQQEVTPPTNCTILTKERITVSPHKQIGSFTVERSRMVSSFSPVKSNLKMSSKRDHVKGRLNFDDEDEATMNLDAPASGDLVSSSSSGSGSGSEAEVDLFDIDFLSENFPFSEVLNDFDLGYEGLPDPCLPQPLNFNTETASGSSPGSMNENLAPDQVVSEYTSTVTEMIQEKDMNTQGSDSMTTVKSITKCLRILSPAKSGRQRSHN
ncbi:unnamed protein product [Eruca vesicaria subsp. sativa]|uniref:Uncharacterized protein n=1 Tax=Eruca vesicaria subsp. sativa TaxID=29727 RepID=A0ABC8LTQ1_ERUVS|nr:unnamed protein product [Eruca vesicaria subsp. sativa]